MGSDNPVWLKPFQFVKGNPGRPHGPNNLTVFLRNTLGKAFFDIGGYEEFVEWAKKNRSDFYTKLWIKLLPDSSQLSEDERERVLNAMLGVPNVVTQIYDGEVVAKPECDAVQAPESTISPSPDPNHVAQ